MEETKKGADVATPNAQRVIPRNKILIHNYNRAKRLCPTILLIAVIAFLVGYYKQSIETMYLSAGAIFTTCLMEVALNPIEEDEEYEEI